MSKGRLWLLSLIGSLLILGLGALNGMGRVDLAWYDWANRRLTQAPSSDIVLVTIDDPSLQELGRWPWPRPVLAALIETISAGQPAALGVDILLSELSSQAQDDRQLVEAIQRSGKVVLPMFSASDSDGQIQAMMPALPFAHAAAAIGHVLVEADVDGTVRSAFLKEGWQDVSWEHFAVTLLRVAGHPLPYLPGQRAVLPSDAADWWQRDYWVHIPFRSEPGYQRLPATDVLRGVYEADFWRGKIVLIGATATGLGDAYPTPVTQDARYMPGVEVSATLIDALRDEKGWRWLPASGNALLTLLLAALALPLIAKSRPWRGLAVMGLAVLFIVALMLGLLFQFGWFWPPMAAILSILGLYFLWNARRLEFALQYLLKELKHIRKLLPESTTPARSNPSSVDVVNRDILELTDASERLRTVHRVIKTVLEGLPDAAMLVDAAGFIVQSNDRAQTLMRRLAPAAGMHNLPPDGEVCWSELVAPLRLVQGDSLARYWQTQLGQPAFEAEAAYPGGLHLWLKAVECDSDPALRGAYIVSLVDISSLRAAEKERDEALRFLSHDLRSPQASILSLVELLRRPSNAPDLPDALNRISTYAGRTIALAEGFVEQARLANQALRWHACDLTELLHAAVDECWSQANAKNIRLHVPEDVSPAWSVAAGDLLFRSLLNLLNNAVKYSPPDTEVCATVEAVGQGWRFAIQDQGRGMTADELARLKRFEAFTRIAAREDQTEESGFGLGLRFVDMVARRHAGFLDMRSTPGEGSCFMLNIWVNQAAPVLDEPASSYNQDA